MNYRYITLKILILTIERLSMKIDLSNMYIKSHFVYCFAKVYGLSITDNDKLNTILQLLLHFLNMVHKGITQHMLSIYKI